MFFFFQMFRFEKFMNVRVSRLMVIKVIGVLVKVIGMWVSVICLCRLVKISRMRVKFSVELKLQSRFLNRLNFCLMLSSVMLSIVQLVVISGRQILSDWQRLGLVFLMNILVNWIVVVMIRMKVRMCRQLRLSGCSIQLLSIQEVLVVSVMMKVVVSFMLKVLLMFFEIFIIGYRLRNLISIMLLISVVESSSRRNLFMVVGVLSFFEIVFV